MKITIIGTGNMGGAIARGLAKGSIVQAVDITCTAASRQTLENIQQYNKNFCISRDNAQAVTGADVVILAVKPWRMESIIQEIKNKLDYEKQIIVSIAGGVTFEQLKEYLTRKVSENADVMTPSVFRVIPNTAIEVMKSMTFIASSNASKAQEELIESLFNELGTTLLIEESQMEAGTALASCGIAFALRYIRAASEGGIELGFYPDQAKEIVAQTVLGAAELLLTNKSHPEVEIDKVTTAGGITIKGLNAMEANGFTTSIINGLKASK